MESSGCCPLSSLMVHDDVVENFPFGLQPPLSLEQLSQCFDTSSSSFYATPTTSITANTTSDNLMENPLPELQNNPRRINRACDSCRRKKIKCCATYPICSNCVNFKSLCSYTDNCRKRGPPKGYITAIERRIERMENILQGLVNLEKDNNNLPLDNIANCVDAFECNLEVKKSLKRPRNDIFSVQSTPNNSHNLIEKHSFDRPDFATNITADFTADAAAAEAEDLRSDPELPASKERASSTLSHWQEKLSRLDALLDNLFVMKPNLVKLQQKRNKTTSLAEKSSSSKITRKKDKSEVKNEEVTEELCRSSHLCEQLIRAYFSSINQSVPVLYEFALRKDTTSSHLRDAVYALGCYFVAEELVMDRPRMVSDVFFNRAKQVVCSQLDSQPDLEKIQTLLLLGYLQLLNGEIGSAWNLMGMAVRLAIHMNLPKRFKISVNSNKGLLEPPSYAFKVGKEWMEEESQRRVWKACLFLDTIISTILGKPFAISDQDANSTQVISGDNNYCNLHDFEAMNLFDSVLQLCLIWRGIVKELYNGNAMETRWLENDQVRTSRNAADLDVTLFDWILRHDSLVTHLPERFIDKLYFPRIYASMLAQTAVLLLHRPFIQLDQEVCTDLLQNVHWQACHQASLRIVSMLGILMNTANYRIMQRVCLFSVYSLIEVLLFQLKTLRFIEGPAATEARQIARTLLEYVGFDKIPVLRLKDEPELFKERKKLRRLIKAFLQFLGSASVISTTSDGQNEQEIPEKKFTTEWIHLWYSMLMANKPMLNRLSADIRYLLNPAPPLPPIDTAFSSANTIYDHQALPVSTMNYLGNVDQFYAQQQLLLPSNQTFPLPPPSSILEKTPCSSQQQPFTNTPSVTTSSTFMTSATANFVANFTQQQQQQQEEIAMPVNFLPSSYLGSDDCGGSSSSSSGGKKKTAKYRKKFEFINKFAAPITYPQTIPNPEKLDFTNTGSFICQGKQLPKLLPNDTKQQQRLQQQFQQQQSNNEYETPTTSSNLTTAATNNTGSYFDYRYLTGNEPSTTVNPMPNEFLDLGQSTLRCLPSSITTTTSSSTNLNHLHQNSLHQHLKQPQQQQQQYYQENERPNYLTPL